MLALLFSVPLALVQGPPGTGKSATIVGMVLQMWGARCNTKNKAQMPRILLVAPSNAAVDELARKLLAVKSQLPEDKRFKIIRIGER
jgi:senataxin